MSWCCCCNKRAAYPGRPEVKEGVGMKSRFSELHLELLSHKMAEFVADNNIFDIRLKCPKAVDTTIGLFRYDKDARETSLNSGTRVFSQLQDGVLTYHLALPLTGWYKLNIFAQRHGTQGPLQCAFTYLLYVTRVRQTAYLFPKQFSDWTSDCYLYSPLFINSSQDLSQLHFKVRVPGVKQVAVMARGTWTMLQRTGEGGEGGEGGEDVWEGRVCLEEYHRMKGVEVTVNAATSAASAEDSVFSTLLAFNL